MRFFNQIVILVVLLSSCTKVKIFTEADIQIIPKPAELKINEGFFEFSKKTKFVTSNASQKEISKTLISKFNTAAGWNLEVVTEVPTKNYIQFSTDPNLTTEAYYLNITTDNIIIKANGNAGFIYGLESIRQLLPTAIESKEIISNEKWIIPNISIRDKPRFKWRGLMLDLSRHFFDKEYIKEIIDGLAMHKINVLHLHLVDDQGWRIEIKKYPKLTDIGAWRVDQEDKHWKTREAVSPNKKGTYGGFLSQDELKELVSYAELKNIEIIPEIEMPAHVTSAIAAYPELSCLAKPVGVPSGGVWPITDIYCAGKESTFEFLENVLIEVIDIFPSKYIHIGGDEATKTNWKVCPHCKKRMKNEGLHDVEELQSYFVKRMEKFINSKGKKLIGWDEILEGGLAPDATVMSWRGVKGGIAAAKQGHDVVMTPTSHCYFDHYQGPINDEPLAWGGYTPLSKVYKFDPVVDEMTKEEAKYVLGGQANLWSEYIPTKKQSQYMIYPRLAALSETLWSPKEFRNWNNFSSRMITMFSRYDYLGINYAKSAYLVTSNAQLNKKNNSIEVTLANEFPDSDIRFNLDGSDLNLNSKKYINTIGINKTTTIKASLFRKNKPVGKEFNKTIKLHKGFAKNILYKEIYNKKYRGTGNLTLTNAIRGTKNFHDGQWHGWYNKDIEAVIDLNQQELIKQVTIGSLENQGPDIYFPTEIKVLISTDGVRYNEVGKMERTFKKNSGSQLKDFVINFSEQNARFIKVIAANLKNPPNGGGTWIFIDEILIN